MRYFHSFLIFIWICLSVFQSCSDKKEFCNRRGSKNNINVTKTKQAITEKKPDAQYSVKVQIIDSLEYNSVKQAQGFISRTPEKITDFEVASELLKGVVEFSALDDSNEIMGLKQINFRNGEVYIHENIYDHIAFTAYYPSEDILVCEGGHSTDISFTLANGKETSETGNPEFFITSPNSRFRMNGSYDGQECAGYFLQEFTNGSFEKIIDLEQETEKQTGFMICNARDGFWTDDRTLYVEKYDFDLKSRYKYLKIKIL